MDHTGCDWVNDALTSSWYRMNRRSALAETGLPDSDARRRVLFVCKHNSARSQMAEGLLRQLGGNRFEAFSAGTEATQVRPLAIRAMEELGIDISGQESKTLARYLDQRFDAVITVCDQANEACPVFFGAMERLHWSFPDPSKATGTEDEQLRVYRDVRDSIRDRIERELLKGAPAPA
jgi:arsenate reductase